jgi:hypothetical protein
MKSKFQIGVANLVLFKTFLLFFSSIRISKSRSFLISNFVTKIKKEKGITVLKRREYADEDKPR